MKPLENVWSGLVQRRLLPVALLLVAALAAIPFVLSKDPESASPVAPAAGKGSTADALADPVVRLAEAGGDAGPRRRVLGSSKNPFKPGPAPKGAAADAAGTTVTIPTQSDADGAKPSDPGTGGTGAAPSAPETPVSAPEVPAAPAPTDTDTAGAKKTHELYSLTVRFGDAESDALERRNLPRLEALPNADEPVLVYLGPGKGAKSAVFMVDEGVVPQGDGVCRPSPQNCETIELSPGDTEFFDVVDEAGNTSAQYQLDLVKIKTSTTANASKARSARAKVSKAGLSVLKAREAAVGPLRYRYEKKSGLVRKLDKRAYRALLAKSARVALGTAGGF